MRMHRLSVVVALVIVALLVSGVNADRDVSDLPLIEWYMIDLPPIQNATGEQRGQGYSDWIRWRLIAELPEYRHVLRNSNVHRMLYDIRMKTNVCNTAFLRNADREQFAIYADALHVQFPNGAAVLKKRLAGDFAPYVDADRMLAVGQWIAGGGGKIVVQSGRSYGEVLDDIVATAQKQGQLIVVTGNRPIEAKLGLLSAGRADIALLYRNEYAYFLGSDVATSPYDFLPVEGNTTYTSNYLACSRSPLGEAVITAANITIARERESYFSAAYRYWQPDSLLELHATHHQQAFDLPLSPAVFVPRAGDENIAACLIDGGVWARQECLSNKE